jgi:hypothetical protein
MTAGLAEVVLSEAQLHALCLVVAWVVEEDHPVPELTAARAVLAPIEDALLAALADLELARWETGDLGCMAGNPGVCVMFGPVAFVVRSDE